MITKFNPATTPFDPDNEEHLALISEIKASLETFYGISLDDSEAELEFEMSIHSTFLEIADDLKAIAERRLRQFIVPDNPLKATVVTILA